MTTTAADSEDTIAAYQAKLREDFEKLAAEKGEDHLQKLLQEDIATCRRRDAELVKLKRTAANLTKEVMIGQSDLAKIKVACEKSEAMCHRLQETTKKREQLTERMSTEMAENRENFKTRITTNMAEVKKGLEEREAKWAESDAENAKLEERVSALKTELEASYTVFQDDLKSSASVFEELVNSCKSTSEELADVQSKLMLARRERNTIESNTRSLTEQLKVYESKFETFSDSAMKPEDVAKFAAQQQEQTTKQIAELERQKLETSQMKQQLDKETIELRAKLASLKKELQQTEKAKMAAEKKCRAAQQALRETSK